MDDVVSPRNAVQCNRVDKEIEEERQERREGSNGSTARAEMILPNLSRVSNHERGKSNVVETVVDEEHGNDG